MRKLAVILFAFLTVPVVAQDWHSLVELGDGAAEKGAYNIAIEYYTLALFPPKDYSPDRIYPYMMYREVGEGIDLSHVKAADPNDLTPKGIERNYVMVKLADAHRLSHHYARAEKLYEGIYGTGDFYKHRATYWYGNMLLRNQKYTEAKTVLQHYLDSDEKQLDRTYNYAKKDLRNCDYALYSLTQHNAEATNISKKLSRSALAYGVSINDRDERLLFVEAVKELTVSKLWNTEVEDYQTYLKSVQFGPDGARNTRNITFPESEGITILDATFTPDKHRIYFTGIEKRHGKAVYSVFYANRIASAWKKPVRLGKAVNKAGFNAMNPSLSTDGSKLYFSSDKPGGVGDFDIWVAKLGRNGTALSSTNLGAPVNTILDEVTPFFHNSSNTLYFSSNGHLGLGGLDVMACAVDTLQKGWTMARNLRAPINSGRDDLYFTLRADREQGFVSTDRFDCKECDAEESCYSQMEVTMAELNYSVKGIALDNYRLEPIEDVVVQLIELGKDSLVGEFITSGDGGYQFSLERDKSYIIQYRHVDYTSDSTYVSTIAVPYSADFEETVYLCSLYPPEFELPGILYEYNKATLLPESEKILDGLAKFLFYNNSIVIELNAHTDTRGSDKFNMKLSEERAKSVVEYLITRGIPHERLESKGMGETQLHVPDAKTEEEHQLNRRTTFKILSEDYVPNF